ncbi:MAG TPA: DUF3592 domain-containing protein [Candidatus Accumulibacter phosphatis]|nr:DUF3592 domain-containing protein [Candidatus Accumulibacter phosphatis]
MADSSPTLSIHPLLKTPSAHWQAMVCLYRAVTLGGLLLAALPLAFDGPQPAGPAGLISLLVIAVLLLQAPLLVINAFRRRLLRQVSAVIATVPGHPVQLQTETTARELVVRLVEHHDNESKESIRIRCDQVVGDSVPPTNIAVAAMQYRVDPETSATAAPARFAIVWDRGVLWGQAPDALRDRCNRWLGVAVVVLVLEGILAVTAATYWNDYRTLSAEWQRAEATRAWPVTEGQLRSIRLNETRVSVGRGWRPAWVAEIHYRYRVGNIVHAGDVIRLGMRPNRDKAAVEQRLEAYSMQLQGGGTVAVFHDPQAPGNAVLETGADPALATLLGDALAGVWICVILGLLVLTGLPLGILWLTLRARSGGEPGQPHG